MANVASDTGMLTKNVKALYNDDVQTWAQELVSRIQVLQTIPPQLSVCTNLDYQDGPYTSLTSDWIKCSTIDSVRSDASNINYSNENDAQTVFDPNTPLAPPRKPKHPKDDEDLPELSCPLIWAKESNAYDCVSLSSPSLDRTHDREHLVSQTDVFDFETGQDLCSGDYYTKAIPIIELQIAKQGYRLAAWLNVIFDGTTGLL